MPLVVLRNPRRELTIDGAKPVKVILRDLDIDPDTVLVIRGEDLLTREDVVGADERIEIRPVISGGAVNTAKCTRCRNAKASVELRRHNAAFCTPCFMHFFVEQVRRAIEHDKMLTPSDRVLVAVSGGKDSLALWDVLHEMGYDTVGYHIVLWTGEEYASQSRAACETFAAARGLELRTTDLRDELGFAIPDLPKLTGRPTCAVCGLTKRHLVAKAAYDGGFDVVATGHNVDDEAAALLGNTLRWDADYLARQSPVLEATHPGFVKKVKPLHRLSEKETASYAFLKKIDYIVEECPQVGGNTQLRYKQALDLLESSSPGTKAAFYSTFIDRAKRHFDPPAPAALNGCASCGMPTPGETCAFCRMVELTRKR
jgi:uncharacterized protein (TIGR00269 family)